MKTQPKPSEIVIMVSGAVALISAFLAWYSAPGDFEGDANAFDDGLFPLATYIGLIGLVMGVLVALDRFSSVNVPERVAGFTWTQMHLILAVFAGLLALGFLILDTGGLDKGIGLWLGVLASIGLIVGAVMLQRDGDRVEAAAPPPPPGGSSH